MDQARFPLLDLTFDTVNKKPAYIVKLATATGFVLALFDPKKWEASLMQMRKGTSQVRAVCLLERIEPDTSQKLYTPSNMFVGDCGLY
jgi:hypothetical protein